MTLCKNHDNGCENGCAVCNYFEGSRAEQKRIIDLLTKLNVVRRCGVTNKLVAFDTNGENVLYLTGLEDTEDEPMTPCNDCGVKIPTDIHAEELGMCVDCSNKYYDHSDEDKPTECSCDFCGDKECGCYGKRCQFCLDKESES